MSCRKERRCRLAHKPLVFSRLIVKKRASTLMYVSGAGFEAAPQLAFRGDEFHPRWSKKWSERTGMCPEINSLPGNFQIGSEVDRTSSSPTLPIRRSESRFAKPGMTSVRNWSRPLKTRTISAPFRRQEWGWCPNFRRTGGPCGRPTEGAREEGAALGGHKGRPYV